MSENKFWVTVWGLVATILIVLMAVVAFSSQATNDKIVQMVREGASPVEASCALSSMAATAGEAIICSQFTLRSR